MNAQNAIGELVDSFLEDLLVIVRRLVEESVAAALASKMTSGDLQALSASAGQTAAPATPLARSTRKTTSVGQGKITSTAVPNTRGKKGTRPKKAASHTPRLKPGNRKSTRPTSASRSAPSSATADSKKTPTKKSTRLAAAAPAAASGKAPRKERAGEHNEREAKVLDAVRFLVRARVGAIILRSGVPKKAVYKALQSLEARGAVTKMETSHGAEYSLPPTGRRSRRATPKAEMSGSFRAAAA